MIITRKQALQQKLKHYFTGKLCQNGHISKRYTKSRECVTCSAAHHRPRNHYRKLRATVIEHLGNKCISCEESDSRVLQIDHVNGGGTKERKVIGSYGIFHKALNDTIQEYQLLCANCNSVKRYEQNEFKKKLNPSGRLSKLKFKIFSLLGQRCIQCSVANVNCLQLDHKQGGGRAEARALGSQLSVYYAALKEPHRFQILCANCNWIKRLEKDEKGFRR
jgi:hypothetical protein